MAFEKIVAVYEQIAKAEDAARSLEASGFPARDITVMTRESLVGAQIRDTRVWQRLFSQEVGDQEAKLYSRSLESGGALLSLRTSQTDALRAMMILNGDGAAPVSAIAEPGREEIIRLAEERVEVGKRTVETGKARIRRFVVERPVEMNVTLHEEHATIERRTITGIEPMRDVDWTETTFDIIETAEQPVVTKSAHVAEEIVVRREGSDRVETVHDIVRRQQIEFERLPRDAGQSKAA